MYIDSPEENKTVIKEQRTFGKTTKTVVFWGII